MWRKLSLQMKSRRHSKDIDIFIDTSGFATKSRDKEFLNFLKDPSKFGYFILEVPGLSKNRVIIRNGLACDNVNCKQKVTTP